MSDPAPIADDMRIVAAIARKLLDMSAARQPLPTHVLLHPSHLPRSDKIIGLVVCHAPDMEPSAARLAVGEPSSVNPGVVVRI